MKVKIGDKYYDSNETPIMVMFNDLDEKFLVNNLDENDLRFCFYPDKCLRKDIRWWMDEPCEIQIRPEDPAKLRNLDHALTGIIIGTMLGGIVSFIFMVSSIFIREILEAMLCG